MIQITEDKLKAAIQIALGSKGVWSDELESILIHDIKALSIPVVIICCRSCGNRMVDKLSKDDNPEMVMVSSNYCPNCEDNHQGDYWEESKYDVYGNEL